MTRTKFREAARDQRVCAVTERGGSFHAHHIIRAGDVAGRGADPDDPRNALRVTMRVHFDHHWGNGQIPLAALTDDGIDFAFELMGAYAGDYLRERYAGEDARVNERLQTEDQ